MIYWIIYLIGIPISVIFLINFGEKLGLDNYNDTKTYADYDDYTSNGSAYLAFSTMWPIFYFLHGVAYINKKLVNAINIKIKKNEKNNPCIKSTSL
jgi:hypothetical protein